MRITAVLLLALVCLNAVSAVSLRKSSEAIKTSFAVERLRHLGKKSQIAHDIVTAVELNLTTGGQIDDVITLLEATLEDVTSRRSALGEEFLAKQQELQGVISQGEEQLDNANSRLVVVNQDSETLQNQLDALASQVAGLEQELSDLEERETLINTAHSNDVTTYAARKQRDENSLSVLDQIINKLNSLQSRGNAFLQVSQKEIERALKRIPKTNPLQALVQISSKFDAAKLAAVISKLELIQTAIQASYAEDRTNEDAAQAHFEALVNEINALRSEKQDALQSANIAQRQAQVDKDTLDKEAEGLSEEIANVTELVNNTKSDLEASNELYAARIKDADAALSATQAALQILNDNKDELQNAEASADSINSQ